MVRGLLVFLSLVATASAQNNFGLGNHAGGALANAGGALGRFTGGAIFGGQEVFRRPGGFTPPQIVINNPEEAVRSGQCSGQGFFSQGGQCFTLHTHDSPVDWFQARQACRYRRLVLAHPREPTGLRSLIVRLYSGLRTRNPDEQLEAWLNAKYDAQHNAYQWQDDFTFIPNGSPLWWKNYPRIDSQGCLLLLAWRKREEVAPYKPFFTQHCDHKYFHVLCEKILD